MPSFLRLLPLLAAALAAAAPEIFPTPRQIEQGAEAVRLDRSAVVTFAAAPDAPTADLLRETLAKSPAGSAKLPVLVGWRGQPGIDAHLEGIPAVTGAYRLKLTPQGLVLAGHDARGAHYAARTLASLLASGSPRATTVSDWPTVAFRGVVEGFYGTPWSHERRLSLIRFMGETKLDTYIYGPKDDPFHSSPNWRKPYPPAEAARIHELVEACRRNHVDFVWAIHPGKDIRWTDADFAAVLAKFEAMHALGVRGFSVFFDDISGEGTKADQQARLMNFLHERFVKPKGDVLPLVMCPTQYNRAWSGGDYLDILGTRLDPSIHVMWTGNSVVADLDKPSMEWINGRLRRKAYIWWNFPVSDYVRNHLLLGPTYGNTADAGPLYGGFVSNPMERSEASKVALFGVADYTWNPAAYRPEAAWLAGIRHVVPAAAEAYATFSVHNSDLGPNGHGYRREESKALAPLAEALLAALRSGKPGDVAPVRAELARVAAAPAAIRQALNPLHLEEVGDWLDAFEALGRAGVASLDALADLERGRVAAAWPRLAEAHAQLARMAEIDATRNRNPYQPGIRTGTKVLTPLVRELVALADTRLLLAAGGRPAPRPRPIFSTDKDVQSPEKMADGREEGFTYLRRLQVAGDWVGVDLGSPQSVRRIRLLQGRSDGDHDRVHDGVLEGLGRDGRWRELRKVSDSRVDLALNPPVELTQIRVRVLKPGVPGGKPDLWTAIRELEVNPVDAAEMRATVPGLRGLPVRLAEGVYSMSPAYEVHAFPSGGQVGMLLPEVAEVNEVEVNLGVDPASLVLEGSADGEAWKPLAAKAEGTVLKAKVGASLRAVRARHSGAAPLSVTAKAFVVRSKPRAPTPAELLLDGAVGTSVRLAPGAPAVDLALSKGARTAVLLIGSGSVEVSARVGEKDVVRPLAFSREGFPMVTLPTGATSLRLKAVGAEPAVVNEVVSR